MDIDYSSQINESEIDERLEKLEKEQLIIIQILRAMASQMEEIDSEVIDEHILQDGGEN